MPFHLRRAVENGVTREEIIGIVTPMAFYAGWPKAMSAINVAKQVLESQRGSLVSLI